MVYILVLFIQEHVFRTGHLSAIPKPCWQNHRMVNALLIHIFPGFLFMQEPIWTNICYHVFPISSRCWTLPQVPVIAEGCTRHLLPRRQCWFVRQRDRKSTRL